MLKWALGAVWYVWRRGPGAEIIVLSRKGLAGSTPAEGLIRVCPELAEIDLTKSTFYTLL